MSLNKVLYNIDQRPETTKAEKKTARDNIGAEKAGKRGMCWATWHKTWPSTPGQDNPLTDYVSLVEIGSNLDSSGTTDNGIYIYLQTGGANWYPWLHTAIDRKVKWTYILEAKWIDNSALWGSSNETRLLLTDDDSVADYSRGAYPLEWACQVIGHKEYDSGDPSTNRIACPDKYKFISNSADLTNTTIQWTLTILWEDVTDD